MQPCAFPQIVEIGESFDTQDSRSFLLYLPGLLWFLVTFAGVGGIGYLFAWFGGSGS